MSEEIGVQEFDAETGEIFVEPSAPRFPWEFDNAFEATDVLTRGVLRWESYPKLCVTLYIESGPYEGEEISGGTSEQRQMGKPTLVDVRDMSPGSRTPGEAYAVILTTVLKGVWEDFNVKGGDIIQLTRYQAPGKRYWSFHAKRLTLSQEAAAAMPDWYLQARVPAGSGSKAKAKRK